MSTINNSNEEPEAISQHKTSILKHRLLELRDLTWCYSSVGRRHSWTGW